LSDYALLFDGGEIAARGLPHEVIGAYQRLVSGSGALSPGDAGSDAGAEEGIVRVAQLTFVDQDGQSVLTASAGDPLVARVVLDFAVSVAATVTLSLYEFEAGTLLTQCTGEVEPLPGVDGHAEVQAEFVMPALLLAPGVYTVGVTVTPAGAPHPIAWRFGRTTLYVHGGNRAAGLFTQPFEFRVGARRRAADVLPL
jgi:hypothetical protein